MNSPEAQRRVTLGCNPVSEGEARRGGDKSTPTPPQHP